MPTNSSPPNSNPENPGRRKFLRTLSLSAGVVGAALLGYLPVLKRWTLHLRPPGALVEDKFLASCIKCGQCVQVCPVEAIEIADINDGFGMGTPYIDARAQACDFSCDGLQCVLACPTGALSHELDYSHETEMGVAELKRPGLCLAVQGKGFKGVARGENFQGKLRYNEVDRWTPIPVHDYPYDLEICDLCVRQCPIEIRIAQCEAGKPPSGNVEQCPPEHAIRLLETTAADGSKSFIPEILSGCVGCGVCEMICPVEPAAIVVKSSREGEDLA